MTAAEREPVSTSRPTKGAQADSESELRASHERLRVALKGLLLIEHARIVTGAFTPNEDGRRLIEDASAALSSIPKEIAS